MSLYQGLASHVVLKSIPERGPETSLRRPLPEGVRFLPLLSLLFLALVGLTPIPAAQAADKAVGQVQRGTATYYAKRFHGRRTASGERFDQNARVAAHPSLPFGTLVRVTNLRNGRSTEVRVVDRGPAKGPRRKGVIIDLTQSVAHELGFKEQGKAPVRLEVLGRNRPTGEQLPGPAEELDS